MGLFFGGAFQMLFDSAYLKKAMAYFGWRPHTASGWIVIGSSIHSAPQKWVNMRRITVCATVLLFVTAAGAQQPEDNQIKVQSMQLLAQRDFAGLNALAAQYRTSGAKTADGLSKLTLFYAGMESLPPSLPFAGASWDTARQANWKLAFSLGESWVKQAPSPAAFIEFAKKHVRYAWERHGVAGDPTPENLKLFHDNLEQARHILEAAKPVASVDPNWADTLAEITSSENPTPEPPSDIHSPLW
jgi:hypothetical protein